MKSTEDFVIGMLRNRGYPETGPSVILDEPDAQHWRQLMEWLYLRQRIHEKLYALPSIGTMLL